MKTLQQWKEERREAVLQMLFSGFMLIMFTIAVVSVAYMAWNVGKIALWRMDNVACLKLQDQAKVFKNHGFYITPEESKRCADYEIDAPVIYRTLTDE